MGVGLHALHGVLLVMPAYLFLSNQKACTGCPTKCQYLTFFQTENVCCFLVCIQLEIEAVIEEEGYAIPAFSYQCPHSCVRNALPGEDACHGLE